MSGDRKIGAENESICRDRETARKRQKEEQRTFRTIFGVLEPSRSRVVVPTRQAA
jgi:hypothetical protein